MLRFYHNPSFKYTNRQIITLNNEEGYTDIDYENIDSPDTINGHIIYKLDAGENLPTYILDLESKRRWFVSGITQLRTGKYQISLLRDIISEDPYNWKNEQAYISAGLATDYNKYKRWDLPFTNTKIKQQRLPINGKSSFFVFYVNTQKFSGAVLTEEDLKIESASIPGITGFDYTVADLNEIPGFEYVNAGNVNYWTRHRAIMTTSMYMDVVSYVKDITYKGKWDKDSDAKEFAAEIDFNESRSNSIFIPTDYIETLNNTNNSKDKLETAISNYINQKENNLGTNISQSIYNTLNNQYVGKIIYNTSNNKVYRINLTQTFNIENDLSTGTYEQNLLSAIKNISFFKFSSSDNKQISTNGNWIKFCSERQVCSFTLEELGTATAFKFNFKADVRKLSKSAVRCVNIVADENHTDNEIAQCLMLAQTNAMNLNNDTGKILDIQYLPFSVATKTNENFTINSTNQLTAEFIEVDDFSYFTDMEDLVDINKETDTIKIVSPSRASQYLYRPYDNDGNMEFHTKITLKPYTSVIYIRPSTKGLLQKEWDDKDCLTILEDFSLTTVTSEWANYIYQNRNYQNAFEREIQGREFERTWERKVEQAQAKSDEWTARNISAQKAQTYTGNIPILSSISGAIGTAFADQNYMNAAQVDREYNEALYQEGLNLSRDLFNMQLENIQSQPNVPTKISTIDAKFLDGVYLEFYSTNQTEREAIRNYYYYNGNRIDCYGTFSKYWGWFVRGKIIISNHYTQPEIDEINRRLNMGIFTGENYD